MALEFFVLGPLEVRCGGSEVPVRSGRQRVLLAALLLRANSVVPLAELTERLWGEDPPRGARNTLRAHVMRLRRALGEQDGEGVISTHPEGYRIEVAAENLDLLRCEALLAAAEEATDPAAEAALLRRADDLWRGAALSDVDSDGLHRDVVTALTEQRLRAVQRRIDLELRLGSAADLVPELRSLTAEHPTRERFAAQLMLALYRSGRQADALETYRRVRALLDAELGVEPGADLQELHSSMLTADPALEPVRTPRATVADAAVTVYDPPAEPVGEPAELARPDEPAPPLLGRSSRVALGVLGAAWLLGVALTISGGMVGADAAYAAGLLLVHAAPAVALAALVAAHRRRAVRARRRTRVLRVVAVVLLVGCGWVLARLAVDHLHVAAMWGVPLFASVLFADTVLLGLAEGPAAGSAPAVSALLALVGAVGGGLLLGSLAVFAQRGMERSWSTGDEVPGAFAEGLLDRTGSGDLLVSGRVVDAQADYHGVRLYLDARHPDGRVDSWQFYNKWGRGSSEPITEPPGDAGVLVPGDATSVQVRVCTADADDVRQRVVDVQCAGPVPLPVR